MRGGMFRGGWEAMMRVFGGLGDGWLEGEDAAVVFRALGCIGRERAGFADFVRGV